MRRDTVFAEPPLPAGTRQLHDWSTTKANGSWRPYSEVAGWRPVCDCGWQGSLWTRVDTADEHDLTAHCIYSPDGERDDFDDELMVEWDQHVAPSQSLHEITDAARALALATERLNNAVRQARAVNASWADIGDAAGISRQSAHERWSRLSA